MQSRPVTPEHPVLDRKIPYGDTPVCVECGECFTNWERILVELGKKTAKQVGEGYFAGFVRKSCVFVEFVRCGEIFKLFEVSFIVENFLKQQQ